MDMNDENKNLLKQATDITQRALRRRAEILQQAFGCRVTRVDTQPLTALIAALLLYVSREIPERIARSARAEAQSSIFEIREMMLTDSVDQEIQELIDQAFLIIYEGELVTIPEAARKSDMTVQRLSALVTSGKIPAYHNPDTPNPRRGRRLVRMSDVKAVTQVTQEIVQ